MITITGAAETQRFLGQSANFFGNGGIEKTIIKIMGTVQSQIRERTKSGLDSSGKKFVPYSDNYKKFKEEHNRPANIVTLHYKGDMLNSIKKKAISGGGELYFNDERELKKATKHEYGVKAPLRPFFGLDKNNENYILREIDKAISRIWR